jgi:hypothetical protein
MHVGRLHSSGGLLVISNKTLRKLAEMICGAHGTGDAYRWPNFPYRSLPDLIEFFDDCDVEQRSESSTRKTFAFDILAQLNEEMCDDPKLPSRSVVHVIRELLDAPRFERARLDRSAALSDMNGILACEGLQVFLDSFGRCQMRSIEGAVESAETAKRKRTWTAAERRRIELLNQFLDCGSEDQIIEKLLVPMFIQLGFQRVSPSGHKDKALEFGKDLWMKYRLPTSHLIYFGAQVKKGKLDAAGRTRNENISEILAQVRMMFDNPIWDPETNRKNQLDHVFIICGGEITKQAKELLAEALDRESRRHVLFFDRSDILDLVVGTNLKIPEM